MATTTCKTVTFDAISWRRLEIIRAYLEKKAKAEPEPIDAGNSGAVKYCINRTFIAGVASDLWGDIE